MKRLFLAFAAAAFVLCSGLHAFAEAVTCRVLADVSIDEWYPDENLNYKDRLIVSTNKNIHHGIARVLLFFEIPDNMTASDIKSAAIYISPCSHCGGGNGGPVGFYALNQPFAEDNDTWNTLSGGDWDESAFTEVLLPWGIDWNQAVDGQPAADAQGMDVTKLLSNNFDKVRDNGIMLRFIDEHQEPYTHQNIASRESEDPLDFPPALVIQTQEDSCPAEVALKNREDDLTMLRQFRDRVLSNTPRGRQYVELYYRHAREIAGLLHSDKNLQVQAQHALQKLLPAIRQMNAAGRLVMSKKIKREISGLAALLESKASPELKSVLEKNRQAVIRD